MLEKKQRDRISLLQIKEHAFFKRHKILFEVLQSDPRPSFQTEYLNIEGILGPSDSPTTYRTLQLKIEEEKKLLEIERKRADSRRENFLRAENTITLVEGDSVKKINSQSIPSFSELEQAEATDTDEEKKAKAAEARLQHRSKFSFDHAANMTDPVAVARP